MRASLITISLFMALELPCQSLQYIKTVDLKKPISSFSVDSEEKIYIGTKLGELYRYLPDGTEEKHYSDIANSPLTTVEAWNRLKIFIFYRDIQKFSFLDRFTTTPANYEVRDFQQDLAWLATPGVDNSLWILSTDYNELRKYDLQTKQLINSTPLTVDLNDAAYMRVYQNMVIIADESQGLYLFDQFSNYIRNIPLKGVRHFQINEGQLIVLTEEDILFIDPFKPDAAMGKIKAPEGAFSGVLVSSRYYFFFKDNKILVYQDL